MKKPLALPDEQPRKIERADIAPVEGYVLIVDGHFKKRYEDEASAKIAAAELLSRYKFLNVEIFDAAKGQRNKFS